MWLRIKQLVSAKKYIFIAAAIALVTIIAVLAVILTSSKPNSPTAQANTKADLTDTCANLDPSRQNIYSCYKNKLNDIVKTGSPEQAVTFVKTQYPLVSYVKSDCHQLMHVVGRAAYAKYGNLADAFAHGDQYCWSGYYHGIMEQISKEKGYDYIYKNASSICAPIADKYGPYAFNTYNCVHGMGHGFMEVLDEGLFKALSSCDSLSGSWNQSSCYGGVFMQNVMNVQGPEAISLADYPYLKADQPMYPCTAVDTKYKEQCYLMQTSYALQAENYDFSKVFTLCANIDSTYQATCYQSMGRDASGQTISDVDKTKAICLQGLTADAQKYCALGAAKDFVSYYHNDKKAYDLCAALPSDISQICSQTVRRYYSTF